MYDKVLSIIIPVYNSEASLKELTERLVQTLKTMDKPYEIIFVNDGSRDRSFEILKEIKSQYQEKIVIINLTRNFGQQNALMCGFQYCNAEYIITLDDDLQNPPEEIPVLLNAIEKGSDAVFGRYQEKKDAAYKNIGSRIIRKLNHVIFGIKNDIAFSSFRIIRRQIIEEIRDYKTCFPYISGMILSLTKKVENVTVKHDERKHGKSNYNLKKLVNLSFNLLINYSSIPLKIICYIGLLFSVVSFSIGLYFIFKKIFIGQLPTGWTSLIVLISFNNAMLMLLFFFFGEYISRMLKELSNHKTYSIAEIIR